MINLDKNYDSYWDYTPSDSYGIGQKNSITAQLLTEAESFSADVRTPQSELHQKLDEIGHSELAKHIRLQDQVLVTDQKKVKKYLAKQVKCRSDSAVLQLLRTLKEIHVTIEQDPENDRSYNDPLYRACEQGKEASFLFMLNEMGLDPKKATMTWEGCDLWSAAMIEPKEGIILKLKEALPMTYEWWNGAPGAGFLMTLANDMVYNSDKVSEDMVFKRFQFLKEHDISLRQRSSELRCIKCPLYGAVSAGYERCFKMLVEDFGLDVSKAVYERGEFTLWEQINHSSEELPLFILKYLSENTTCTQRDKQKIFQLFKDQIEIAENAHITDVFKEFKLPLPNQQSICLHIEKNLGIAKPEILEMLFALVDWKESKDWVLKGLKKAVLESEHKYINVLASKINVESLPPSEVRALWNTAFASGKIDVVKKLINLKLPVHFGENDSLLSIATEWQNPEFLKAVIDISFTEKEVDRAFTVAFEEGKLDIVRLLSQQSENAIPMVLCSDRSATKEAVQKQMEQNRDDVVNKSIIPALISSTISEAKDIFDFLESLDDRENLQKDIDTLKSGYQATHAIAQYPARLHRKNTKGMYNSNKNFANRQWNYAESIEQTYCRTMSLVNTSANYFFSSAASSRHSAANSTGDKHADKYTEDQKNGVITPWGFLKYDNKTVRFPHYGNCLPLKNEVIARLRNETTVPGVVKGYHLGDYTLTYSFEGREYELTEVKSNTEAGKTDFGIFPSSSTRWSTVWNHPSRDSVEQLWREFDRLDNQLTSMTKEDVVKDPIKFRETALRAYWLGCNMTLTMRGHAQNTWMWFLKKFKDKGVPLPRISQKIGTSDTAAITIPLHMFIERADEFIEGLPALK